MLQILVVDDEATVGEFCRLALTKAGHSVKVTHSGQHALECLSQQEFDLVLSDIKMPGMSGLELLQRIATRASAPEVVLFTGHGSVASAVQAMRSGAFDYLPKPFSEEQLIEVVEQVARGRAHGPDHPVSGPAVTFGGMVGESRAMLKLLQSVLRVAPKLHPVLIAGETGVGKELVARAIHKYGPNPNGPFVTVDCGVLRAESLEEELFGSVQGASPGAGAGRTGLLAKAAAGTVFLDGIGELRSDMQARFLRVLQEGEYRPVGSDQVCSAEARVITATRRNLEEMVARGEFRAELFYRLNTYRLDVPPLRARKSDIPLLIRHFVAKHSANRKVTFSSDAIEELANYSWPGNVRELENCVLQMLAQAEGKIITGRHIPRTVRAENLQPQPEALLDKAEKETILAAIREHQGRLTEVAAKLGISKATLYRKLKEYGLTRKDILGGGR